MSRRSLIVSMSVAILCFCAINLVVFVMARNSIQRQVLRRFTGERGVRILAIGDSLLAAGFDQTAFADTWPRRAQRPLNAALGATDSVVHVLLMQEILKQNPKLDYVVLGFKDTSPTWVPPGRFDDLYGYGALVYHASVPHARDYYPWSASESIVFTVGCRIPVFVERTNIWGKVELLRRRIGGLGLPPEQTGRFGRLADSRLLSRRDDFLKKCDQATTTGTPLFRAWRDMIRLARQAGATPIVVEMPVTTEHLQSFYSTKQWCAYQKHIQQMFAAEGATYMCASKWLNNASYFEDAVHMSTSGARAFSKRLASEMIQLEQARLPAQARMATH